MGADLYRKGFEENAEKEHPAFEQACKARGEHQAPWPKMGILAVDMLTNLIKVFIVLILVGVIDAVNPRIRVDQAIRYFAGVWVVLAVAIAFALVEV